MTRFYSSAGDPSPACAVAAAGEAFYLRPTATFASAGLALQPRGAPVQVLARTQLQQGDRVLYLVQWVGVPYFAAFVPRSLGACADTVPRITVQAGVTAAATAARLPGVEPLPTAKLPNTTRPGTPTVGFLWSPTLDPGASQSGTGTSQGGAQETTSVPGSVPATVPGSVPGSVPGTVPSMTPPVPTTPPVSPGLDWRIPAVIAVGVVTVVGLGLALSRRQPSERDNPRRRRRRSR